MRKSILITVAVLMVAITIPAFAELQNVTVGGSIRIRGNWGSGDDLAGRPSPDDNISFVEQRTTLNVTADFTDMVSAYIELENYGAWGRGGDNDVDVYQAYIEANEMWGYPLRIRIGRQELVYGSEWLLGNNNTNSLYPGLSYDAVKLTYATDQVSVDAIYAKLVERSALEEDGDLDLYALYVSYLAIEDVTIDAYWIYLRDATAKHSHMRLRPHDWWRLHRHRVAVTYGDVVDTHTFGLRGAGTLGAFDFEAEAAWQHVDVDTDNGFLWWDDDDDDSDSWAANLELGYTFDTTYTPRIFLGGAYFDGGDNDDLPFNRLASDWEYSQIIDLQGDLTGFWTIRGGVTAMATEAIELALTVAYFEADDDDDHHHCWRDDDDDIGWEVGLSALYDYSEDLSLEVGYSHFFTDEHSNALRLNDDIDYVYFETKLCF